MQRDFDDDREAYPDEPELERYLWDRARRGRSRTRLDGLLQMYAILGGAISITGIAYFYVQSSEIVRDPTMALTFTTAGVILTAMSLSLLVFRKQRIKAERDEFRTTSMLVAFIRAWTRFERAAKELLEQREIEYKERSIANVIDELASYRLIANADLFVLEAAIQARNAILHRGDDFDEESLENYADAVLSITNELQSQLHE